MLPPEIMGLISDEEHETLGPCGCSDYHMADCPIRDGSSGMTKADYLELYDTEDWYDD